MNRFLQFSAAALIAASSFGCAGRQYHQAGDAAASHGDMRSAYYNYERALAHDSGLRRDPEFMGKLARAEAQVAYDDAVRLQQAGRYEAALQKLEMAVQRDPGSVQAAALLNQLRPQAARERYDSALDAADQGDLATASRNLYAAAAYDPDNPSIRAAQASITPDRLSPETPGLTAFRAGDNHAKQREWRQALNQAETAIAANPDLLPARTLRFAATRQLNASQQLVDRGGSLLRARQVGQSIADFQEALEVWPGNEQAQRLLGEAEQAREQADARFAEANAFAAEQNWDRAISVADAGLEIDRSHANLAGLRRQLPTRAAEDATRRGRSHLQSGEVAEAESAFRQALNYVERYEPAQRGMAEAYQAWGVKLEQDGRFGAALLHYRVGRGYSSIGTVNDGVARNYSAIRTGLGMGLVYVVDGPDVSAIDTRTVSRAVGSALAPAERAGIALGGEDVPYSFVTRITTARVDQEMVRAQTQRHRYVVQEWQHNAEYDRIGARHQQEDRHYQQLSRQYQRRVGHSHRQHDPHHDHHAQHLYNDICEHERIVNQLHHQLRNTPRQIQVDVPYDYEFIVESHRMTGQLVTRTELIDNATGDVIDSFDSRTGFEATDDTIRNPRPEIGLSPDPLELPERGRVETDLSQQIAAEISGRTISAMIQHRIGQFREQSTALREAGDADAALEIDVQAAVLLGMIDQKGMNQMLDRLGQQYTR